MDLIKILLLAGVGFNLVLVAAAIYVVNRYHLRSRDQAHRRQAQLLEQGKIISAQERALHSKEILISEQRELIREYREGEG